MAPVWFNSDNFWRSKGARTLASGGGHIAVPGDINQAAVVIPWSNTPYLYCGAGACNGEMTAPDDPHLSYEPPMVTIRAGKYDPSLPNGRQSILGRRGLDTFDVIADKTGEVGLQADGIDDPMYGPYPKPNIGYPPISELQYLSVEIRFRHNAWQDGRSVFIGDWWLELYVLDDSNQPGPGNGDVDPKEPIVCPTRPPWPYRDPIRMVSAPDSAQIRRSRP